MNDNGLDLGIGLLCGVLITVVVLFSFGLGFKLGTKMEKEKHQNGVIIQYDENGIRWNNHGRQKDI